MLSFMDDTLALVLLVCTFSVQLVSTQQPLKKASTKIRTIAVTSESEKKRDVEGFDAITQLHRMMDDDRSGSIDRTESTGFLREDMHIAESERVQRREKKFHQHGDESVTVNDLWESWFESDARSWTVETTVDWLINGIQLPQYVDIFIQNKVDGQALPRMAVQNSSFLSNILGIKNPVHRQKLQLKAMDVVLFGYRDISNRVKDVALAILGIVLIGVLCLFAWHKSIAQRQVSDLTAKMHQLQALESDFQTMQEKFDSEQKSRDGVDDDCESNEEVESLRCQVQEYERRLERTGFGGAPLTLQPFLRHTCTLEMAAVGQQRLNCVQDMRRAIDTVEKLRKKQSSMMSSFKLATGSNDGTENVDQQIVLLKNRMEKITQAMDECQQRWLQIESICGFPLIGAPPSGYVQRLSAKYKATVCRQPITCHNGIQSISSGNRFVQKQWSAQQKTATATGGAVVGSQSTANLVSSSLANGVETDPNVSQRVSVGFVLNDSTDSSSVGGGSSTAAVGVRSRKVAPYIQDIGRSQSQAVVTSTNATTMDSSSDDKRKRIGLKSLFKTK